VTIPFGPPLYPLRAGDWRSGWAAQELEGDRPDWDPDLMLPLKFWRRRPAADGPAARGCAGGGGVNAGRSTRTGLYCGLTSCGVHIAWRKLIHR
jgi:hypothetical protein